MKYHEFIDRSIRWKRGMATRSDVERWLGHLSAGRLGLIHLTNMYLYLSHVCTDVDRLKSFLGECADRGAASAEEALEHLVSVCTRFTAYGFMVEVPPSSFDNAAKISTTISSDRFHFRLVGEKFVLDQAIVGLVFEPPARVRAAEISYARTLRELTETRAWIGDEASLGVWPSADTTSGYAWLTYLSELERELGGSFAQDEIDASELRDILGLIHHRDEPYLIVISIPATELKAVRGLRAGRPTFANLGNERFAAFLPTPRAGTWYAAGWGMTVHLGKLCDPRAPDIEGVPERVVSPIALAEVDAIPQVDPVGRVSGMRGRLFGRDDDASFADRLSPGTSPATMIEALGAVMEA